MAIFPEFLLVSAQLNMLPLPVRNLDGLGLRMDWDIERTRGSAPDQATITVFNLSPTSRKAIHETWRLVNGTTGYTVELSIGWGGLVETVFKGDVWSLTPEVRVGEDVVTVFQTGDGVTEVRDSVLGQSFAKLTVGAAIRFMVLGPKSQGLFGLPYDPASEALVLERAAKLPLLPTYIFSGNTADTMDDLIDQLGLEWKVFNGVFIVMEKGNAATASKVAFPLSAQTGLLTWAQENDSNIVVEALANPGIKPGHQIAVIDSFGVPVGGARHRVESITFSGNTDGESVMSITARKSQLL